MDDDDVDIVQSNVILRYVGRKYGLSGANLAQQAAVEEVRGAYIVCRSWLIGLELPGP